MNRDSTTTAEIDRAENVENLKNLLEAHAALLHESTGKQNELAKDLASCEDKLDAMQVNIDQSQTKAQGHRSQCMTHKICSTKSNRRL